MRNYQRQQKYSKYRRKTTTVMTTGVNIKKQARKQIQQNKNKTTKRINKNKTKKTKPKQSPKDKKHKTKKHRNS